MSYGDMDAQVGRAIRALGYNFPVVYDVGGSNGAWVNIMSKVLPESRFEVFEPLAEINPSYREILGYLKGIHQDAHLHPIAIGEKDGSIKINIYDDPVASTTLAIAGADHIKPVKVPVRSIDSIVASRMCAAPDLLKIDIQGGELAALKGARQTLPGVKFLMLETWLQRSYGSNTPLLHELISFLSPLGFVPYEFGDVFRNDKAEAVAIDVWFINRAKAHEPAMF
ncbi:FkbM family methyltransferase [Bosea sp. (in: a-proteobacteria)]|jgi:FkbM family methyltransferase|uniref:FkbM family methyltransferase n=1 Tax=Bosea sp. (in: a-proteobacteria) TaxID=1871050 RepID=UPI003F709962